MAESCYSERVDEALVWVADAFRCRRRKGSDVPYLSHLLAVAALVAENGGEEEQVIAALLHDALEDIEGASAAAIERGFGPRVRRLVKSLSDTLDATNKPAWRPRKEHYIARLRTAGADVKLIAACDKLHNAGAIRRDLGRVGDTVWSRFSASRDETLWYYRAVTDAIAAGFAHPLVGELRAMVRGLHAAAGAPEPWRGDSMSS